MGTSEQTKKMKTHSTNIQKNKQPRIDDTGKVLLLNYSILESEIKWFLKILITTKLQKWMK